MSLDLRDLRAKVTPEADAALEVRAQIEGKDKSELVRDILQRWAVAEIHAAKLLAKRLQGQGNLGEFQGKGSA